MNYQWYPGHMTKAKRMMQEDIKLIDVVIELVDARIPISSKNPDIDELAKNKARIILLNKFDLADNKYNELWKKYFEDKGYFVLLVNSKDGKGINAVNDLILEACKEKIERDKKRGIKNRTIKVMVVGIPNVGKSTFINSFAKRACTKTGNKPGVTKGKQWIKLKKNIELLDTPGILWPKFDDQSVGLKLALIGSIKAELLDLTELGFELVNFLETNYNGVIKERYNIQPEKDAVKVLEQIAISRGCKLKGDEPDINKASSILIEDFRDARLGRITLELI